MNSTKQISKSLNPLDHTGLKGTIPRTEKSAPSAKHTKYKSTPRGKMLQLQRAASSLMASQADELRLISPKMHKEDFILVLKMCDTISQTELRNAD